MPYETIRQVSLIKGRETYIFRYVPWCEHLVAMAMVKWAINPNLDFDCFDAAILVHSPLESFK